MLLLITLAAVVFAFAAVPCVLFCINLRRYQPPCAAAETTQRVAVLIPARNEERNIAACVESVLASEHAALEVLVLDDASTDATAAVVAKIAEREPRVRLIPGQPLPPGWNGKQHACCLLARATDAPLLLFLDADVRLAPDAVGRCVAQIEASDVALLSGFPRLINVGWMERLLLPLIHFVLLGFLPMDRMRATTKAAYAAGCGQFFLSKRDAYFASGGHAAIRSTRHDGLKLPQSFRRAGFRTDIFDLTALASVRMYESPGAVWMGLAKNATEGLGAPARIVPLSLVLLLGQVMPTVFAVLWTTFYIISLVMGATFDQPRRAALVSALLALAVIASYLPRLLAVRRFQQPLGSALVQPLGILTLLAVQWYALAKRLVRSPIAWRDRT